MKINLESIVWKEGGFYVAQCLNIEVNSFGHTRQEALFSLQEALELYFEDTPITEAMQIENPELFITEVEHV